MMYRLLRPVISFCLRQFFSSIKLNGAVPPRRGPVLFVANHPNFALDSLVVASVIPRDLWFLAKSTLFRGALLERFFRSCHMVPVYRKMDGPENMHDNEETFRVAVATLREGRALVIFPEGVSMGERQLQPLKTGAARIAFQVAEASNFTTELQIQPVGLTYTDLRKFRAPVTVTFGDPIMVAALRDAYERDAIAAVRDLTARIGEGIRAVTVEVADSAQVALVEKLTQVYRSYDPKVDDLQLMKTIAENVSDAAGRNDGEGAELVRRIDEYLELCSVFTLDDSTHIDYEPRMVVMVTGLPFILLGILTHYLPYRLVRYFVGQRSSGGVETASLKFGFGVATFGFWYLLVLFLLLAWCGAGFCAMWWFIAIVASGFVVNNFLSHFKLWLLSRLWPGSKKPLDIVRLVRDQLVTDLNTYRSKHRNV